MSNQESLATTSTFDLSAFEKAAAGVDLFALLNDYSAEFADELEPESDEEEEEAEPVAKTERKTVAAVNLTQVQAPVAPRAFGGAAGRKFGKFGTNAPPSALIVAPEPAKVVETVVETAVITETETVSAPKPVSPAKVAVPVVATETAPAARRAFQFGKKAVAPQATVPVVPPKSPLTLLEEHDGSVFDLLNTKFVPGSDHFVKLFDIRRSNKADYFTFVDSLFERAGIHCFESVPEDDGKEGIVHVAEFKPEEVGAELAQCQAYKFSGSAPVMFEHGENDVEVGTIPAACPSAAMLSTGEFVVYVQMPTVDTKDDAKKFYDEYVRLVSDMIRQ